MHVQHCKTILIIKVVTFVSFPVVLDILYRLYSEF